MTIRSRCLRFQKLITLNNMIMETNFIKVRSAKDLIVFITLIICGSVLVALPTGPGVNITGFFMIFAGIITALILKSGYRNVETGESYKKKEYYFQREMFPVISSALESRPNSIDLAQADKGNAIKLDIYYSKSTGKAYLQLFKYIPYTYDPCSVIYEYELATIDKLIK